MKIKFTIAVEIENDNGDKEYIRKRLVDLLYEGFDKAWKDRKLTATNVAKGR
jgi:hypothetical protein